MLTDKWFLCSILSFLLYSFVVYYCIRLNKKQKKILKNKEEENKELNEENKRLDFFLLKTMMQMAYDDIERGFVPREWIDIEHNGIVPDYQDVKHLNKTYRQIYRQLKGAFQDKYNSALKDFRMNKEKDNSLTLEDYNCRRLMGINRDKIECEMYEIFLKKVYEKGYDDAKKYEESLKKEKNNPPTIH